MNIRVPVSLGQASVVVQLDIPIPSQVYETAVNETCVLEINVPEPNSLLFRVV